MTETLREALINAKAELARRNDQHHDIGTDMVLLDLERVLERCPDPGDYYPHRPTLRSYVKPR